MQSAVMFWKAAESTTVKTSDEQEARTPVIAHKLAAKCKPALIDSS